MLTNTSVIYFDPFDANALTYDGKEFGIPKNTQMKTASRVLYNDIIIHSFKVNVGISDAELKTLVEIKMYEEAGLDLQKKYSMVYIKKELEFSDTVLVEAFAIEQSKTKTTLQEVLKHEKYIDFLALPFLAFSTLYSHKLLAPKNDLFVHIASNEAFLALYKDGHYISTKSILNFEDMIKRLKREEIELSVESLGKLLVEKGLDAASYNDENSHIFTALQTLFSEIFTKINDIVMHNRNIFGFDTIDRIFMNTNHGRIKGLRAFLLSFGYTDTEVQDFKLFKNCACENLLACITASYAFDQINAQYPDNITFFMRPPAFFKTEFGKLSLVTGACLLIASLYPAYLSFDLYRLKDEQVALSAQNEAIKKASAQLNAELTKIKNEVKSAHFIKEEQVKALENIAISVDELSLIKLSPKTYVDFMVDVNLLLKQYGLMVRSIEQKGANKMLIEVVANEAQRDTIAKFMEALIAKGFLGVTTDEVRSDKMLYISKIEIAR